MEKSVKILVVILAVIFLTGIFYKVVYNSNSSNTVVAEVNSKEIYSNDVIAVQAEAFSQGHNVTINQSLSQIINEELIFQEAEKQGYLPDSKEAETKIETQLKEKNETLEGYKSFLNQNGKNILLRRNKEK